MSFLAKIEAALALPQSSKDLTREEVVKMLYLASGWLEERDGYASAVSQLDELALTLHDDDLS